jgi:hypothetical protein
VHHASNAVLDNHVPLVQFIEMFVVSHVQDSLSLRSELPFGGRGGGISGTN